VPSAGVEEAKTEYTAAATAVTSNAKSRAAFESQSSDRIAKSDVAEDTMSAMVKLAKDPLEPHYIDQHTEECHLMVRPFKRKLVTRRDELPLQRWSRRHQEHALTSHTEMCKKSEVTSLEEGHDVERVIVLKDETSADLTTLEKKGLDRKTNHEGLMKAETQPRSARPPLWRDKSRNRGESMLWLASSYWEHEATIQEGVKKYHLHSHQFFAQRKGPFARQVHERERNESLRRRWLHDPHVDDHSEQQDRECTNLDQPLSSARLCFSLNTQTLTLGYTRAYRCSSRGTQFAHRVLPERCPG